MKKKTKSSVKSTGSSLMADIAGEIVDTKLVPVTDALKSIQESLKLLAKPAPKTKKAAPKAKKAETEKQDTDVMSQVLEQLKTLNSSNGRRVKDADGDEDEDEDENDEDDLKNHTAENADYLKNAIATVNSPARYGKLSAGEQEEVKNAYMAALLVQTTSER